MCGDATNKEHVKTLMDGQEMDLILTDPPYGIDIVGSDGKVGVTNEGGRAGTYKPIENDETDFDPSFLLEYDAKTIIFGGNHFTEKLPKRPHWIVWDKKANKGEDHNNFSDCELAWTNVNRKSTLIYRHLWSGMVKEGSGPDTGRRVHPTQKPVGLLGDIIKDYTEREANIIDLFGGSGTTLLAAEQTNRKCFMMELDPQYCQVIINRWEELTGKEHEVVKQVEA